MPFDFLLLLVTQARLDPGDRLVMDLGTGSAFPLGPLQRLTSFLAGGVGDAAAGGASPRLRGLLRPRSPGLRARVLGLLLLPRLLGRRLLHALAEAGLGGSSLAHVGGGRAWVLGMRLRVACSLGVLSGRVSFAVTVARGEVTRRCGEGTVSLRSASAGSPQCAQGVCDANSYHCELSGIELLLLSSRREVMFCREKIFIGSFQYYTCSLKSLKLVVVVMPIWT
ncbi:hypothetical protein F4821DRAFT_242309 [Hypoxylon rubiginosum]|uniref:Uncharacterized protein n=1 Tax=Hypoxylon rubiginosum TaxID=110542 RepID=A0ACC0CWW1_9PEZI|nr:hypothetical protein F4821DRAFT_242309 [Hypoxylon rubiginosum]